MAGLLTATVRLRSDSAMRVGLQTFDWGKQGEFAGRQANRKGLTVMIRVVTNISANITAPYPDRKFDGIFTITMELSPIASPAFEVGR